MCVLHVSSSTNSFAEFLRSTRLPVYQSHEKGDTANQRRESVHEDFGFSCDVSERERTDFPGQVHDAMEFLRRHDAELQRLRQSPEVHDLRLDFPIESSLSEERLFQFEYIPPELIRHASQHGIGIEISFYAPGDRLICEPAASPNAAPPRR